MPSTRPSLARLSLIDQTIGARQYPSVARLADRCAVTTRTIKRDLQALRREFGAPLQYCRVHDGYYYSHPFTLAALPLSEGELLALCLLSTLADTFRGTPFDAAIAGAARKMRLLLPEPALAAEGGGDPVLCCVPDPAPRVGPEFAIHFRQLYDAVRTHRQVRLTYHSMRDEERTRVIDPHRLYEHRGMWYLHGHCHLRDELRDFALVRIRTLSVLDTTFIPPSPADLQARLASRFHAVAGDAMDVAIRFDAEEARRIRERIWHPSQRIEDHEDGSCTLHLRAEGLPTLVRWVLSFGRHVQVVAPAVLADAVRAEVDAMCRRS